MTRSTIPTSIQTESQCRTGPGLHPQPRCPRLRRVQVLEGWSRSHLADRRWVSNPERAQSSSNQIPRGLWALLSQYPRDHLRVPPPPGTQTRTSRREAKYDLIRDPASELVRPNPFSHRARGILRQLGILMGGDPLVPKAPEVGIMWAGVVRLRVAPLALPPAEADTPDRPRQGVRREHTTNLPVIPIQETTMPA